MARFHSFWLPSNTSLYVHIHHIFIHSSVNGHLGSFHTLAIVDSAAVNIGCMCPFETAYLYPLDKYLVVQLLGSSSNFFLSFLTFIHRWETERQSTSGRGAEREGDTESEAGSRLWAVLTEPDVGLELTNLEIMTWVEVRRFTDWATQALLFLIFWETSILFSRVAAPACIPTSSAKDILFLHILTNICCCLSCYC